MACCVCPKCLTKHSKDEIFCPECGWGRLNSEFKEGIEPDQMRLSSLRGKNKENLPSSKSPKRIKCPKCVKKHNIKIKICPKCGWDRENSNYHNKRVHDNKTTKLNLNKKTAKERREEEEERAWFREQKAQVDALTAQNNSMMAGLALVGLIMVFIVFKACTSSTLNLGNQSEDAPGTDREELFRASPSGTQPVNRRGISTEDWEAMTPHEQDLYDQRMRALDSMSRQDKIDIINKAAKEAGLERGWVD